MRARFAHFAARTAALTGSYWAFLAATAIIVVWALTGPIFGFSDTWQLVINTGTTIITFLVVFLIQNSQNRDTKAIHLKLDELLRAVRDAREARFVDLEDATEEKLEQVKRQIERESRVVEAVEASKDLSEKAERASR